MQNTKTLIILSLLIISSQWASSYFQSKHQLAQLEVLVTDNQTALIGALKRVRKEAEQAAYSQNGASTSNGVVHSSRENSLHSKAFQESLERAVTSAISNAYPELDRELSRMQFEKRNIDPYEQEQAFKRSSQLIQEATKTSNWSAEFDSELSELKHKLSPDQIIQLKRQFVIALAKGDIRLPDDQKIQ